MRPTCWYLSVTFAVAAVGMASCTNSHVVVTSGSPQPSAPAAAQAQAPRERDPDLAPDFLERSRVRPLRSLFNSPGLLRRLFGGKVEAYNVTAEDDVEDSSWFTRRNGRGPVAPEAVARGPNRGPGPDTSALWTAVAVDDQGDTPYLTIRDATGEQYLIQFDSPEYPELATAAEVIAARLFYAAG